MKYIKKFDRHADYEAYINGGAVLPNVSYCVDRNEVHFNPYDPYNGHEYVDLGLPSGTLWAKCNVGAETETDYGLYFQWGDTQGYTLEQSGVDKTFNESDYKWFDGTPWSKYNTTDRKMVLDLEDDAAHINMGGRWRMPTSEEFTELLNGTRWEYVEGYNNVRESKGILFYSRTNSNVLFIPKGYLLIGNSYENDLWMFTSSRIYDDDQPLVNALNYGRDGSLKISELPRVFGTNIRGVIA